MLCFVTASEAKGRVINEECFEDVGFQASRAYFLFK